MDLNLDKLRKLRLTTEKLNSSLSIETSKLMDEYYLKEYLVKLQQHIGAANMKVAASIFIKRYAFLSVIYLYTMTSNNKRLNISFKNVSLETKDSDELWLPCFYFHHLNVQALEGNRQDWRASSIEILFKEHISPILNNLSYVTKLSKLVLWENIAVYIFWLYETVLLEEGISQNVVKRAEEDFQSILSPTSNKLFGDYSENPLARYYKGELGTTSRKRITCCYSHLTNSDKYCTTCPHISKEKN
ncbi:IucA/IucC family C-terminal-domain containing protein [Psychrobacillus sp. FJAT-51614]|uniref:IucA/IucC family C-terminal-domain containing protein n=1 Tax=Psychrobacillus mangrovi TaxID=3117745 RepID=A0ABU8F6L0_9BACI